MGSARPFDDWQQDRRYLHRGKSFVVLVWKESEEEPVANPWRWFPKQRFSLRNNMEQHGLQFEVPALGDLYVPLSHVLRGDEYLAWTTPVTSMLAVFHPLSSNQLVRICPRSKRNSLKTVDTTHEAMSMTHDSSTHPTRPRTSLPRTLRRSSRPRWTSSKAAVRGGVRWVERRVRGVG